MTDLDTNAGRYFEGDTPYDIDLAFHRAAVPQPVGGKVGGRVILMGWSIRETSGLAVASVIVHNGTDASGLESASVNLNASDSVRDWFGPRGILLDNGYFPVVTGAVAGAVWLIIPMWSR